MVNRSRLRVLMAGSWSRRAIPLALLPFKRWRPGNGSFVGLLPGASLLLRQAGPIASRGSTAAAAHASGGLASL
jgi:hypothetical protein